MDNKAVAAGVALVLLIIVVIASFGVYHVLTRPGGGGGTCGGEENQPGDGTTPGESGTITSLAGTTLDNAVTQIKGYATAQGYSDTQLTYTAQGTEFTREGKADWSDIVLYSSSANVKVEYSGPGTCNVSSASSPIQVVSSYTDTSQIAAQNQDIWDFADGQVDSSIGIRIDNFPGREQYPAQMAYRVKVDYGPPAERDDAVYWFSITTGQKLSA
jgi:hypothetical protein